MIGESNAERIKIEAGTALAQANGRQVEIHIKGRDLKQGRHKTVVLGPQDMAEALSGLVGEMAEFIQRALEDLPPKIAEDVMGRGIVLTGGGALLDRLDQALTQRVGVQFLVPQEPHALRHQGHRAVLDPSPAASTS